ncbi:MAG: GNAT family N-acetyltransferase [Proteobacteria bacterium]|nr:GNAT family N-acetyltransferase [Pseudomonadota bacterium]
MTKTARRDVRPYDHKDLAGVMSAWETASALAHPFLSKAFLAQERHNIPNVYLPNADTWLVEQDEAVIGFIALIGNEVGAIFLDPAFHGTGAGKALMDKAVDLNGALEVEVFRDNAVGRKFYDKHGFKVLSERMHEETGNMLLRMGFYPAP